ncbi:MAG: glycosyltransferase family A protein [Halothiobacillaceae bacterium]|nr:glycosyltransferase family A protein [Halothiobacillaceae bacterium]
MLTAKPTEIVFEKTCEASPAQITVTITCFKYGVEGREALDSLLSQTETCLDVVLIDDRSPDDSVERLLPWFEENASNPKFGRLLFIRHVENQGLSQSRNTALSHVKTPYVFILDADNMIYPRALQVLREALENSGRAMAYSLIERFEAEAGIMGNSLWIPERFAHTNYVDAMALIRMDVLREIGGYRIMPFKFGWEDYDLWCSFVDRGLKGCHVPQILCRYRVHYQSMLRTSTNNIVVERGDEIRADMEAHHNFKFLF